MGFRDTLTPAEIAADPALTGTYVQAFIVDAPTGVAATDTAAINAAIAAASAAGGGVVQFRYGTYVINAAIALADSIILRGVGSGTLIQVAAGANVAALSILGKYNILIEQLGFDGRRATGNGDNIISVSGASGRVTIRNCSFVNAGYAAISTSGGADRIVVEDVDIISGCYIGIQIAASTGFKGTNININGCTATTTYEGGLTISGATRPQLTNVASRGNAGHACWIGGATTGCEITNGDFSSSGTAGNDYRGVTVHDTAEAVFTNLTMTGNMEAGAYSTSGTLTTWTGCVASGNNVGLRPGGHGFEMLGRATLAGCRATGTLGDAANEGCGYYIAGAASLTDCDAELNYSAGIRVYDGTNVNIKGGIIRANSQRVAGGHHGIQLDGATATTHVRLIGVRAYDDQGTKTQEYGISIAAVVNYYVVLGCDTQGNRTGGISDSGGANKAVANNL